jgi:hypothetical protein
MDSKIGEASYLISSHLISSPPLIEVDIELETHDVSIDYANIRIFLLAISCTQLATVVVFLHSYEKCSCFFACENILASHISHLTSKALKHLSLLRLLANCAIRAGRQSSQTESWHAILHILSTQINRVGTL